MKLFAKVIFFLYILVCVAAYCLQDKLIFNPHVYDNDYRYTNADEEHEIPLENGIMMNAVLIQDDPTVKSSKGVILYFHGNKGNVRRAIYQTRQMRGKGYDIFIPDYRGYGKTEGSPISDKQMLEDAQKAYAYLSKIYPSRDIIALGYSLGSGMASYIAKQNDIAHLILLAPFTSLTAIKNEYLWMIPNFLMKYKLSNKNHLQNVTEPVTILHGTNDQVVNYKYGQKLKELYPKVNLITLEGVGHRRIIFDPTISRILKSIN